jgi:hypothetical protein
MRFQYVSENVVLKKEKRMISHQKLTILLKQHEIGVNAPKILARSAVGSIFSLTIEGEHQALNKWQQARDLAATTGLWPVVGNPTLGKAKNFLFEQLQTKEKMSELLHQARGMDAMQVLAKRLGAPMEIFSAANVNDYLPEWIDEEIVGTWPDLTDPEDDAPQDYLLPGDGLRIPSGQKLVKLYLLPIYQSWEIPALLNYGGWNSCPPPTEHISIHKFWQDRYGAEIVSVTPDTLEFYVPHPPTTQQDCRKLALEHFAYCHDRITGETLEALAASLLRNHIWYFWWD